MKSGLIIDQKRFPNMNTDITKDDWIYGPWRKAINDFTPETRPVLRKLFANPENPLNEQIENVEKDHITIHDDNIGKKIGMRGGVVAGIQHLDLFAPLVLNAFGEKWFETGSISMFYTYATLDGEEVRATLQCPPKGKNDVQVEARVEMPDGRVVATGTLSYGNPEEKSYLQVQELKTSPQKDLRILKGAHAGYEMTDFEDILNGSALEKWTVFLEDSLQWYSTNSPWGPPIAPLSRIINFMQVKPPMTTQAVGFYGGTEIRFFNGPVKADVHYLAKGRISAVGVTSKTEYYWFDSQLYEKGKGDLIAGMRHMSRYMKAGSPLYPEI
jgi:hypothetical protein